MRAPQINLFCARIVRDFHNLPATFADATWTLLRRRSRDRRIDVDDHNYHQWSSRPANVPRSHRVWDVNFGFLTCAHVSTTRIYCNISKRAHLFVESRRRRKLRQWPCGNGRSNYIITSYQRTHWYFVLTNTPRFLVSRPEYDDNRASTFYRCKIRHPGDNGVEILILHEGFWFFVGKNWWRQKQEIEYLKFLQYTLK